MIPTPETSGSSGNTGASGGGWLGHFVSRPVAVLMLAVTLILVGAIAMLKLPIQLAPQGMSADEIQIYIPTQNLTPVEVEQKVAEPLEEQLRTIPGIREVRSYCRADSCYVAVELNMHMSPQLASAEVRDRVQRAKLSWPNGVDRYWTWKESASDMPLMFFSILIPEQGTEWNHLIDSVVRPRLEAVDGVGRLEIWGLVDEAVRIQFDREKIRGHRMDLGQILEKLRQDNFTTPVGDVEESDRRFLVRVDSRFHSVNEIANIPLRPGLLLKDVALVERSFSYRNNVSKVDGKFAYSGMIRKSSGVNAVEASENVTAAFLKLEEDPRLSGLGFHVYLDQGKFIRTGLDTLLISSMQGGGLALIVLFLFLWRVRLTIAIALSIPMSLLATMGYLFFTGDTLNICTMAGMTLAVGMVVDNAVVVMENIFRHRQRGLDLTAACKRGVAEVALPVTLATLTTVVVFMPLIFISENPQAQLMMSSVGMPLSFSLIASLLVALVLLPAGVRALYSRGERRQEETDSDKPARVTPVTLGWRATRGILGLAMKRRVTAVVLGIGVMVGGFALTEGLEFGEGRGGVGFGQDLEVRADFGGVIEIQQANDYIGEIEKHLEDRRADLRIDNLITRFDRRRGRVLMKFDDEADKHWVRGVRKQLREGLPRIPGVEIKVRGGGSDEEARKAREEDNGFAVVMTGRDSETLRLLGEEVADLLRKSDKVASVDLGSLQGDKEVQVDIDRSRAQELGVDPEILFGTMIAGLRGTELQRFEEEGREIRVIAEYQNAADEKLADLKDYRVWSSQSGFTSLGEFAKFSMVPGFTGIDRENGKVTIWLMGEREEGVGPIEMSEELDTLLAGVTLPRGYEWRQGGSFRQTEEDLRMLMYAGLLSTVLVFLLMGVLFESTILPMSVLFTIPFAIMGALLTLRVFGLGIDPMAMIGLILLAGVVVNNGIVLLSAIVRLRDEGMDRVQAIMEGARIRFRPIVMTALTTIVGLLPMALSTPAGATDGISYRNMAVAVAGGLFVSTFFTVFSVPLAYTFFDDTSAWLRRAFARVFGRNRQSVTVRSDVASQSATS